MDRRGVRYLVGKTTVGRELKAMGFRKLSARPRHYAQNGEAIDDFKKLPRRVGSDPDLLAAGNRHRGVVAGRSPGRAEEQDHAALGQARDTSRGAPRSVH